MRQESHWWRQFKVRVTKVFRKKSKDDGISAKGSILEPSGLKMESYEENGKKIKCKIIDLDLLDQIGREYLGKI